MIPLSGLKWQDEKNVDQNAINMIKAVGHVGCDGTAVNTGIRGGIIRLLEVALNRPLQWFVCQPHANELPLKCISMGLPPWPLIHMDFQVL